MIRIKILSVGKTHEKWLEEGFQMYVDRLSSFAHFEWIWLKDALQLEKMIEKEPSCVLLDPLGHERDSQGFSDWFFKRVEEGGARLTLAIGPAEGFSRGLKEKHEMISLSRLTYTHQLTRLILMEQIFRAFEIRKGSAYHK